MKPFHPWEIRAAALKPAIPPRRVGESIERLLFKFLLITVYL